MLEPMMMIVMMEMEGEGRDDDGREKEECEHGRDQSMQADGVIEFFQVPVHHSKIDTAAIGWFRS